MKKLMVLMLAMLLVAFTCLVISCDDNPISSSSEESSREETSSEKPSEESSLDSEKESESLSESETESEIESEKIPIYTVTFSQGDGYPDIIREVEKGSDLTDIPTPKKVAGYELCWEDKDLTDIQGNMTVSIVKTPVRYVINYVTNGGVNSDENILSYTIETEFELKKPTRIGYIFRGWYTDEALTIPIEDIGKGSVGNLTLYAGWKADESTVLVTFDLNNGEEPIQQSVVIGQNVTKPEDPTRNGYDFAGWFINDEQWSFSGNTVSKNITIVAKWTPSEYTITFAGNVTNSPIKYTIEDTVTLPDGIANTGYTFEGWYEDEALTNPISKIEKGTFGDKTVYAASICEGFEFSLINDEYSVTGYDGVATDVIIPSFYNGKRVTSIGARAFFDCTSLTSVTISDSVTSIGGESFRDCTSLTSVTIPNSVTTIGISAFSGCTSLTYNEYDNALYLGNDTNAYLVLVKARDTGITSCTINEGTKFIHSSAFYNCTSLTSVTIPNSVTLIDSSAFYNCTSLTSVTIPDSVTSIGNRAFSGCTALTSVTIPDSVTEIGYSAFYGCTSLTSVTIGNSVTSIGEWAFEDCTSLKYNEYDNGCYLGNEQNPYLILVKARDTSIASCTINKGTKFIHSSAFSNCTSLTSVTIGDSVTSIDSSAFSDCTSLASVKIGNSVTTIGNYAFSGCTSLTSVTIPNSVTSIGVRAFRGCTLLTTVTIGDSVTTINLDAFRECTSLTSVTIGNSVTSIGITAFLDCTSLTSIEVDENNTAYKSIDGNLYSKDEKTLIQYALGKTDASFVIPNSVTSIGDYAFSGCKSLASVTIPDSVTSIGNSAFSGCTSLTSVNYLGTIEQWCNVEFANEYANPLNNGAKLYLNGTLVTELVIPNTVTEIKDYAFYRCTSLTSVTIPDSVTTIGRKAFSGCTSLTSVTIPNSVTSIGYYAFDYSTSLTIYCEAEEQPSGWDSYWKGWNYNYPSVVWGHSHSYTDGECICRKKEN